MATRTSLLKHLCALAAVVLAAVAVVDATQVMQRPANYKKAPNEFQTETNVKPHVMQQRAGAKVNAGYFTNWGIYGANFQPTDIIPSDLTHILYSFADISPSTGAISLTDSYADEQKHFPGDSWDEPGNNLYGCLKQMYLLKLANRNLKVLLSVGGYTYSQSGHFAFVTDASLRATFVKNAVQLIEDYAFDGIDLDFEYPANAAQGQGFADLYSELRTAFDNLAQQKGDSTTYQLTAAVSAGAPNYANLVVPQMNSALNYWNLMAYDYAGSWLTWSDNQANLYGGERTGVNTDMAVQYFKSAGADANKLVMGIPLYGRSFEKTAGLGQSYDGVGSGDGIYSYKVLPIAGSQVFENTTDVSSYSYDSASQELVSYDTPHIVTLKAQYVQDNGMAGSMYWDLSTDKVGSDSLVGTVHGVYGKLNQTENHINYPNSKWDNIRNQMGGGSPTTTSAQSGPTGGPGGQCSGVVAWSAGAVFTGGQTATYNDHLWMAKWWTQGDIPGSSVGVWTDDGPCQLVGGSEARQDIWSLEI